MKLDLFKLFRVDPAPAAEKARYPILDWKEDRQIAAQERHSVTFIPSQETQGNLDEFIIKTCKAEFPSLGDENVFVRYGMGDGWSWLRLSQVKMHVQSGKSIYPSCDKVLITGDVLATPLYRIRIRPRISPPGGP